MSRSSRKRRSVSKRRELRRARSILYVHPEMLVSLAQGHPLPGDHDDVVDAMRFQPEVPEDEDWRVPVAGFCFLVIFVLVLVWMVGWSGPQKVMP